MIDHEIGHGALLFSLQPLLAILAAACGLLSLWLGYATLRNWRKVEGPNTERVIHAVVAVAGVLFLWQMTYWNVLTI